MFRVAGQLDFRKARWVRMQHTWGVLTFCLLVALTVHVNSPWPWAKLTNIRIRNSLLDLELRTSGELIASIDGKEVARNSEWRLELRWEVFN